MRKILSALLLGALLVIAGCAAEVENPPQFGGELRSELKTNSEAENLEAGGLHERGGVHIDASEVESGILAIDIELASDAAPTRGASVVQFLDMEGRDAAEPTLQKYGEELAQKGGVSELVEVPVLNDGYYRVIASVRARSDRENGEEMNSDMQSFIQVRGGLVSEVSFEEWYQGSGMESYGFADTSEPKE